MNEGRMDKLISFVFALFAVVTVWLLNPPAIFHSLALSIGAVKDSILYIIIVNGFTPLVLTIAAWLSVEFYQKIIWPLLPNSEYKGGWWVYALIAETETGRLPVVGYFQVQHKPTLIALKEGRSFYFDSGSLVHRGDWHADTVWQNNDTFKFIFSMETIINQREPRPSQYNGFIDIKITSDKPYAGKTVWCGHFHDLGDRRNVVGPICGEYIGKVKEHSSTELRTLLDRKGGELVSRTESRLCNE